MLPFLTKRKMTGGLYFGPAAWTPDHWEPLPRDPAPLWLPLPPNTPLDTNALRPGRPLHRGEVILPAPTPTYADLISPIDATLQGLIDIDDVRGGVAQALILQPDPNPTSPPPSSSSLSSSSPPTNITQLRTLLQRSGIARCSATVPSLLAQLADLCDTLPSTILFNMIPTQPESRLPLALATLDTDRLLAGIQLLKTAIPPLTARRYLAALDRADWRLTKTFRRSLKKSGIQTRCLLNQYPQSHPTLLLSTLFGIRLPVADLPTRAGILILDPITLWALGGLAQNDPHPLLERPIEIFAMGHDPKLLKAPLGTRIGPLLEFLGIPTANKQCILNGMLSGVEVDADDAVIEPATMSISLRDFPTREHTSPCFACGWCVDHCPTELNPFNLFNLALAKEGANAAEALEALNCIACGLCTYVCPTRLPLAQEVVGLKGALHRAATTTTQSSSSSSSLSSSTSPSPNPTPPNQGGPQ